MFPYFGKILKSHVNILMLIKLFDLDLTLFQAIYKVLDTFQLI